jgi:hypothetical protein
MRKLVYVVVVLCAAFPCLGQGLRSLLQSPTVSKTEIAFAHGGDIWIVGREGGEAAAPRNRDGSSLESYLLA